MNICETLNNLLQEIIFDKSTNMFVLLTYAYIQIIITSMLHNIILKTFQ